MARISWALCALRVAMSSAVIGGAMLRKAGCLASQNIIRHYRQTKTHSSFFNVAPGRPRALLPGRRTPTAGRRLQDVFRLIAARRLLSHLPAEGDGGRTTRLGPANSRPR